MKVEYHVVPYEDMGFDDVVDMKVTQEGTEFMRRNESKTKEDKYVNFGTEFLHGFKAMCAEQAAVSDHIDLSNLNQTQQFAVKSLIEEYAPERNANAPVQMKIILKDYQQRMYKGCISASKAFTCL